MDSLYSRYAIALLSLAKEENKVKQYKNEIKMLKHAFLENEGIMHLLSSYNITISEKEEIIDSFYRAVPNIANFIKVIVRNKRSKEIIKIFDEFILECNEELGIKEGIVYSVDILDDTQVEQIEQALAKKLNVSVELTNLVDTRLIGGVKVVIEDKVYDGSIKNKLDGLKNMLTNGGL